MKYSDCLAFLKPDEWAVVNKITAVGKMRRRLLDIGLTPGTPVQCVGKSALGDPSAYLIRGAVIAIRQRDARDVLITKKGEGSKWD